MDLFEHIEKLTQTPGPSGMEGGIAAVVQDLWSSLADEFHVDRIGSLRAVKRGDSSKPRRQVLLAAHMDELGLMVTKIAAYPDDDSGYGFLRVHGVGGVDRRQLYGQLVTVHGKEERSGVIGALPDRMRKDDKQGNYYDYEELVVDVGLPVAELRELVSVGDYISFHQPLRLLLNDRIAGKALDNRISVAAVTVCLEELSKRRHAWDVVAVATAQEETALLGAFTTAFDVYPDAAVTLDVTFGKGPDANDSGQTFDLDKGPTIGIGPNFHPAVTKRLQQAAERLEMAVQNEAIPRPGGTDAYGLQVARAGIPTGQIGIPLRNMHTMVETAALDDVRRAGRLLAEFIVGLDEEFLEEMRKAMVGEL